jgi:hypothetical protein
LELVAIAGHPVGLTEACQAIEAGPERNLAWAALRRARLIRGRGITGREQIETYHDLVREMAVSAIPPQRARDWHHRLARTLEHSTHTGPDVLCKHFLAADRRDKAGKYAILAAERAAEALAFENAAEFYRLALRCRSEDTSPDRERHHLQRRLAEMLTLAGLLEPAGHEYESLSRQQPLKPQESRRFRRLAAEHYLSAGNREKGLALMEELSAELGLKHPKTVFGVLSRAALVELVLRLRGLGYRERRAPEIAAEDLERLDLCWLWSGVAATYNLLYSYYYHKMYLLRALRTGEVERIVAGLAQEAVFVATTNERQAREIVGRARHLESQLGETYFFHGGCDVALGITELLQGRWRVARDLLSTASSSLRAAPTTAAGRYHTRMVDCCVLQAEFHLGELGALARRVMKLLQEAQRLNDRLSLTLLRLCYGNSGFLIRDEALRAQEELNEAAAHCPPDRHAYHHWYLAVAALQLQLYQRHIRSWDEVDELCRRAELAHGTRVPYCRIILSNLRGACAVLASSEGRNSAFLSEAKRIARQLERENGLWVKPLAKLLRAQLALFAENETRAQELLGEAARQFQDLDMSFHAVVARKYRGELIGGDEGRAEIAAAEAWFRQQNVRNHERMASILAPGFVR